MRYSRSQRRAQRRSGPLSHARKNGLGPQLNSVLAQTLGANALLSILSCGQNMQDLTLSAANFLLAGKTLIHRLGRLLATFCTRHTVAATIRWSRGRLRAGNKREGETEPQAG